ncbi:hypothetical protein QQF64_025720 [Cirrhinus molitorella]|uniref:Uncharacterized protein n=1 Tax=Cirrhinus molitorella TaxID=172907 RepID=A0ABR3NPT9_9TELE
MPFLSQNRAGSTVPKPSQIRQPLLGQSWLTSGLPLPAHSRTGSIYEHNGEPQKFLEEVEMMKGDAIKAALNLRKWICVQQLSRVGGSSVRDCVDKVIDH